jgi:hypothetical protein
MPARARLVVDCLRDRAGFFMCLQAWRRSRQVPVAAGSG